MVLKRVYMQNTLYYLLIFFLSFWAVSNENNISVLAFWFLPMLYYIFLTTQLNHTRKDQTAIKVLHYILFIMKFALTYITLGLLQTITLPLFFIAFIGTVILISTVEYFLLRGKNQVIRYKDLYFNSMKQVMRDPEEAKETTKYKNETGLSFVTLGFLIGSIHYLEIPKFEFSDILINALVALLSIYLYRRFQLSNKKTFVRILKHQLMTEQRLKRIYIFGQILLHLSFLATIGIKTIEGPNTITLLMLLPILMNYPLIYLNRVLAKGILTEQEKEILNVD
jgi:hypothetical protein